MFGDVLPAPRWFFQAAEVLAIQLGQPQALGSGDDAVEDWPAAAEAAALAGEAADEFGPAANLLQGPVQEASAAQSSS
jgi:hypothetical protein